MSYLGTYYFGHVLCEMPSRGRYERLTYHPRPAPFSYGSGGIGKKGGTGLPGRLQRVFPAGRLPELLADLDPGEIGLAAELAKNGQPERDIIWQVINHRMFKQVRGMRRGTAGMEGVEAWVGLFNRFMECGVARATGGPPTLRIYCAEAERFAPYFCDHVAQNWPATGRAAPSLKT